jgi:crotonobetainyl-CoA:carnitine CoA-transferase CaiB-like acyl-CoA transferase
LAKAFLQKTTDQWMEELEDQGVLCARINTFEDAARDPQIACNKMIVSMEDSEKGELKLLGTPVRLQGTPPTLQAFPPRLGQHTREVALELGYSEDELASMAENGVFG